MKFIELQAAFELEINLIDKNLVKPKSIDIEYWLNRGLEKFYKTRYTAVNYKNLGFEQDLKRIDDLRTLVDTKYYTLDNDSWYLVQEDSSKIKLDSLSAIVLEEIPIGNIHATSKNTFYLRLPNDYVFHISDSSGIIPVNSDDVKCAKLDSNGNIIPSYDDTIEATFETLDKLLRNSLSEHRLKYNRARPLRLIQNNKLLLFTDGKYKVQEFKLTYLRKPKEINIHKNPHAEYIDMPEHTHSEIIKLAVQMYLENQSNNRYNTYLNEVSQME